MDGPLALAAAVFGQVDGGPLSPKNDVVAPGSSLSAILDVKI